MLVPRACGSTLLIQSLAASQDPERHPHPQRDAQVDREKIIPEANEYAKSGTDNTAAKNDEAAFDPNITDPKKKAGEGNTVNPLDASPANLEISKGTEEEGGSKKKLSEGGGGRQGGGETGKGEQST
jgi:hypothetical protein